MLGLLLGSEDSDRSHSDRRENLDQGGIVSEACSGIVIVRVDDHSDYDVYCNFRLKPKPFNQLSP